MSDEELHRLDDLSTTFRWLGIALLLGLSLICFRFLIGSAYSIYAGHGWVVQGNLFTSLLWSLGWFGAAFLFGFIFGIPKVAQGTSKAASDVSSGLQSDRSRQGGGDTPYQLRVNTNLEEISDWLTKILVGATLTQLVKIPGLIRGAAEYMSKGMTEPTYQTFAASVIIYFSSLGFLSGYVLTRMFFSRAFGRSDQSFSPADVQLLHSASIALGSDIPVTQEVQRVAEKSRAVPITDALSGSEAANVATGAIIAGDTKRALEAAKLAVDKSPTDPRAHLNYAVALYNANPNDPHIVDELEKARTLVRPDLDPRTAEDIYNSIIYLALYLPPPQGFTKAIQYGEMFIRQTTPKDAGIWINLACAYGQQYKYVKEHGGADDKLTEIRKNALRATANAISLDPGSITRLRELYHASADPEDDDLKIFEGDPDFEKLLGS